MCGIAGFVDPSRTQGADGLAALAAAMGQAIAYRGPDGSGVWTDPAAGVALAHRRLAVVDLSATGAQPMASADGRFAITYNGELYNTADLRNELAQRGHRFRGTSDTEVLIEAIAAWGIDEVIVKLNGMYAFAVWDCGARTLHLVRDRTGIKPLFFTMRAGFVAFASELKALLVHPAVEAEIDPAAVVNFIQFGYVPAPRAIFREVDKVEPGEIVSVAPGKAPRRRRYWSAIEAAKRGLAVPFDASDNDATDRLEALLADAVSRQMVSDVPLGAFLSGGIDSSTVVALMQRAARGRVRTFSIGFASAEYDESRHAERVAAHLGTEHTSLRVEAADALALIPRLPDMYDEPFGDSSQIPTHMVSALTRAHVTVALSGDGGDELFAGYNRYAYAARMIRWLALAPLPLRRFVTASLHAIPPSRLDRILTCIPGHPPQPADKLMKLAGILPLDSFGVYRRLVLQNAEPDGLIRIEHDDALRARWAALPQDTDVLLRMQLLDLTTYLPDDILAKVDRASMAVALEVRVPLLDHRVVEFAMALPTRFKYRGGRMKWLLRQVLHRHVPVGLVDRPKQGFGVPLAEWLCGPLRDWAEELLDPQKLYPLLDARAVRQLWDEHAAGRRSHAYGLWTILMLEAWRRRWRKPAPPNLMRPCAPAVTLASR